ncbi:prepilin-type N-terminal cleavage/methylation domain-containing protein [Patescibacteria group bacterium]|nr:prepilin-type N-terminal cleavage/methylation domain-containing protein [Patescibacteria group bacterium]MBU0776741.1 prepilin-type N-terminal cleavage/methylation domain-containing protein [Patescibacteria group bacterium]MBU0846314.1 prepilin-type N-terminal cleavage/methylation domain-containing protein [Patescibacteria group bacterium]MBU0922726.1 prepilin-type N-terminal cleavage/methylation domain-containing protein [Patescibacteria group bacterium]MBU1066243.1 prepilin-type N-terminal
MKIQKGFTLVEILVVIVLLAIIAVIVIATINPLEQLRRAKDSAREQNAETLLSAINRYQVTREENPEVLDSTDSISCEEIAQGAPVYEADSLESELSSWFLKHITQTGSEIYVGFNEEGNVKICYQVESSVSKSKISDGGCSVSPFFYMCLPR